MGDTQDACKYNHNSRCYNYTKMRAFVRTVTKQMEKNGMTDNCKNCNFTDTHYAKVQPGES